MFPSTIKRIAYEYPNIKFICGNQEVAKKLIFNNVEPHKIFILKNNVWYNLGLFKCMVQPLTHDVMNNCIHIEINNKKLLYAVDTNSLKGIEAINYDMYLIEGNYDKEILEENKKKFDEKGEYDYLYRVEETHLSIEKANDFLIKNMGNNSQYQLIHQSELNVKGDEYGDHRR